MKPITKTQYERLRTQARHLVKTLDHPGAWHAIQVLNTATGNTAPAPNPNSSGKAVCSCDEDNDHDCPHGTPTEKAALAGYDPNHAKEIRQLSVLNRLIIDLSIGEAIISTRMPKPVDIQCPSCTDGRIAPDRSRCNNDKCLTHIDTRTTCAFCDQVLTPGTLSKAKPHKLPDGTPVCGTHHKRAKRKGWHTAADYQLDDNVITEGAA